MGVFCVEWKLFKQEARKIVLGGWSKRDLEMGKLLIIVIHIDFFIRHFLKQYKLVQARPQLGPL